MTLARPLRAVVSKYHRPRLHQLIDLGEWQFFHRGASDLQARDYQPIQRISGSFRGTGGGAAFGWPTMIGATGL